MVQIFKPHSTQKKTSFSMALSSLYILLCILIFPSPVGAQLQMEQTIAAGFSGGITYLGGLRDMLQVEELSAFSGTLFLDFNVGDGANVRLGANFGLVSELIFSSFETNFYMRFPIGRLRGIGGGGIGLFSLPVETSSPLHISLQALIGMEQDLFRFLIVKFTMQASQVISVTHGLIPGMPLFRIEAGFSVPFRQ